MNSGPLGMFPSQEPFQKLVNISCVGTKGTRFLWCLWVPENILALVLCFLTLVPVSESLLSWGPGTLELATVPLAKIKLL